MVTCVSIDKYYIELKVDPLRIEPEIDAKTASKSYTVLLSSFYRKNDPKVIQLGSEMSSEITLKSQN